MAMAITPQITFPHQKLEFPGGEGHGQIVPGELSRGRWDVSQWGIVRELFPINYDKPIVKRIFLHRKKCEKISHEIVNRISSFSNENFIVRKQIHNVYLAIIHSVLGQYSKNPVPWRRTLDPALSISSNRHHIPVGEVYNVLILPVTPRFDNYDALVIKVCPYTNGYIKRMKMQKCVTLLKYFVQSSVNRKSKGGSVSSFFTPINDTKHYGSLKEHVGSDITIRTVTHYSQLPRGIAVEVSVSCNVNSRRQSIKLQISTTYPVVNEKFVTW